MNSIVGKCPQCGEPVYEISNWYGIIIPNPIYICGCAGLVKQIDDIKIMNDEETIEKEKTMNKTEICDRMLLEHELTAQLVKVLEEMGELQIEISKWLMFENKNPNPNPNARIDTRDIGRGILKKIIKEAVDVQNTLSVVFRTFQDNEYF